MVMTAQMRLFADGEIRAQYERERSIREACSAIGYYGRKLDEAGHIDRSYFVPISSSFARKHSYAEILDHLRVHASALGLAWQAKTAADRITYYLAADELERILEANEKKKGTYSQRRHADMIRTNPHALNAILQDVTKDEGVVHFWKDHIRQQRSGKLSANCTIELKDCIENHFASKLSIQEMFAQENGPEGPHR